MSYPPQIEHLHTVLGSLPSVTDVSSGIESLQGVTSEELRLSSFGTLPIGALHRTKGGLDAEALIQFELVLNASPQAWRTIEFLAWFIRDQSRGGMAIQLRPFALPPEVQGQVQLGHTLRWHIDLFCAQVDSDLSLQLEQVGTIARELEMAMRIYGHTLAGNA